MGHELAQPGKYWLRRSFLQLYSFLPLTLVLFLSLNLVLIKTNQHNLQGGSGSAIKYHRGNVTIQRRKECECHQCYYKYNYEIRWEIEVMSFYSIQTNTHAMLSLRIDNTGFDEFSACFQYGAFLFCVRGCFCLLSSRRVFCGHFVIFDGLGSGFF